jgi:hypothetical protein
MAKDRCLQLLLIQVVRAVIENTLPSMTLMTKLHTFLGQFDVLHELHPIHAVEALGDWVPRLLEGITASSILVIQHPPLMLTSSTSSLTYMDSVLDIIATPTPPVCTIPPSPAQATPEPPEPRFTVDRVTGYFIDADVDLFYWVVWEHESVPKPEVYKNLYHLTVFKKFERGIRPRSRSNKSGAYESFSSRRREYKRYITLRNLERDRLVGQPEEYDTPSDSDQVMPAPPLQMVEPTTQQMFSSSPLRNVSSNNSLSWTDLMVNLEDDCDMASTLDMEGTFGQAGPSDLGKRRKGGARTASSWDDFATKQ